MIDKFTPSSFPLRQIEFLLMRVRNGILPLGPGKPYW